MSDVGSYTVHDDAVAITNMWLSKNNDPLARCYV